MKWLERFFGERRSVTTLTPWTDTYVPTGPTAAGVDVSAELALTVPAVFACVQTLAQDIARTPILFRQRVGDAFVSADDHALAEILGHLPNPETTSFQFVDQMTRDLVTHGKAYAQVERIEGKVTALWWLDARYVWTDRDGQRRKRWHYTTVGQRFTWVFDPSMPPILELTYTTPLTACRELIGTALAQQQYVGKFFANSGRLAGVLESAGTVSEATLQRLRDSWDSKFAGSGNAHRTAILDNGLSYKAFNTSNTDAELSALVSNISTQIAGCFRLPPWKIGLMEKTSYSNMSSGERAYVTATLDPIYSVWESAIRRDLLTNRQFNRYVAQFDRTALIKSDTLQLHTALSTGVSAGFYSQNDCRKLLGLNPIQDPEADTYRQNAALVAPSVAEEPTHVA